MLWPARAIGTATALYGAALMAKPSLLTKPTGLSTSADDVTIAGRVLSRAVGARDLVSGVAMALAPTPAGVRLAGAIRVGADVSDALGLGLGLPSGSARRKSAAVAAGWGALTILTLLLAGDD